MYGIPPKYVSGLLLLPEVCIELQVKFQLSLQWKFDFGGILSNGLYTQPEKLEDFFCLLVAFETE